MTSIAESLIRAESILAANGVAEPRREAVSLLMLATKRDRTFLYAHPESALSSDELDNYDSLLQRRAAREPFQYISGVQEFYGLEFEVTPDVLIPRPETEMVVERAIEILSPRADKRFCEVGIGSGCIAVSILRYVAGSSAVGLDVSDEVLRIARRNSEKHGVAEKLSLVKSDVFSALVDAKFEMIVSNPPYVPVRDMDGLQAEVRSFEPRAALTDGLDGLSIIRRIVTDAPRVLSPGGVLLMEIGFNQSEKVVEMFNVSRWRGPKLFPDLQGIPRLLFSELI